MKKSKAAPKSVLKNEKSNKNNKSSQLMGKLISSAKTKAKTLVKAMSAKPAKKVQTKAPAKAAKAPVKVSAKAPAKPALKAAADKGKKSAPVKAAPPAKAVKAAAPVAAKKELPTAKNAKVAAAPAAAPVTAKGAKPTATPVVAAILKKATKGAERKAAAALAAQEHADRMCRETACENYSTTKGYCRLHYIQNWKKIKRKEMILKEGKLNQYVEELVSKYPDKYIEVIRQDLITEVNFNKVIHDLELDESIDDLDYDGDSIDSLIGSIRKDGEGFDDDEF